MQTKSVLIVAADPDVRGALANGHREGGYAALEAGTELEALEKASLDQPSLIVVRVDDAGLDGWTTIKRLGESPRTERIPVVAVSAAPSSGEERTAALLGCSGLASVEPIASVVELTKSRVGEPATGTPRDKPPRVIRRRYARR
jgi:CheY-like chemotaxis protein